VDSSTSKSKPFVMSKELVWEAPRMEQIFHADSFGYRPGRSALAAVRTCRDRCWKRDRVVDLDIQDFFGSVDHDLTLKAVKANLRPGQSWVLLYVRRWATGKFLTSFAPAVSGHALKVMSGEVGSWRLHARTTWTLDGLAAAINPSCEAGSTTTAGVVLGPSTRTRGP
jgi:Reverse transcriptase (RNA-dependent DNA polymerase)